MLLQTALEKFTPGRGSLLAGLKDYYYLSELIESTSKTCLPQIRVQQQLYSTS